MADNKWLNKLNEIASTDSNSLEDVVPKALLLPVIAFATSLADTIGAAFGIPIATFDGISESLKTLIDGIFAGPGRILDSGAEESAQALSEGVWAQFGPFTFIIAVAVVVGAALLLARAREQPATGNVIALLPFDVPFLGADEEGE